MSADFALTAKDYRRYRQGFPDRFFEELRQFGIGLHGQRILDVGTGTGSLARGLARGGAQICAIDIAEPLLIEARDLDLQAGVEIEYLQARAEALPYGAVTFDVVTAGQCWHWFDREQSTAEASRVLRPGGRLVIAHFDWLPIRGSAVAATEALILEHNPSWKLSGTTGIYPGWCEGLTLAGLVDIRTHSFDVAVPYSHEEWRGRIRASAGVAASLSLAETKAFDRDLGELLAREFPEEPLQLLHRVWTLICQKPH